MREENVNTHCQSHERTKEILTVAWKKTYNKIVTNSFESVAQQRILFGSGQSIMSSVTNVLLNPTVLSVHFLSLFRWEHGFLGDILGALLIGMQLQNFKQACSDITPRPYSKITTRSFFSGKRC